MENHTSVHQNRTTMVADIPGIYIPQPHQIDHRAGHSPSIPSFTAEEPNPSHEVQGLPTTSSTSTKSSDLKRPSEAIGADGDEANPELPKRFREGGHECCWTQSEETELMRLFSSMALKLRGWNNLNQWELLAHTMHKNLTTRGQTVFYKSGIQCRNKWRNMRRKYSALSAARARMSAEGLIEDDIVIPHYFTEMDKVLVEHQKVVGNGASPGDSWTLVGDASSPGFAGQSNSPRKSTSSSSTTTNAKAPAVAAEGHQVSSLGAGGSKAKKAVLSKNGEEHLLQLLDHFKNMMDESLRKEDEFWDRLMEMQTKMQKSQQEFTLAVLDKLALILGGSKEKQQTT